MAIDLVRRVALTSGLLLMPSPRTALCLAIVLNLGFGWLYTEANPFFEDWTGSVRGYTPSIITTAWPLTQHPLKHHRAQPPSVRLQLEHRVRRVLSPRE